MTEISRVLLQELQKYLVLVVVQHLINVAGVCSVQQLTLVFILQTS